MPRHRHQREYHTTLRDLPTLVAPAPNYCSYIEYFTLPGGEIFLGPNRCCAARMQSRLRDLTEAPSCIGTDGRPRAFAFAGRGCLARGRVLKIREEVRACLGDQQPPG